MRKINFLLCILMSVVFVFTACEKDKVITDLQNDTSNAESQFRNGNSRGGDTEDPEHPGYDYDLTDAVDIGPFNNGSNLLNPDNNDCDIDELDLRILFVGNSFTANYTVNLNELFEDLAVHNNQSISVVSVCAQSGYTLADHLTTNTCNLINQGNWDYIVLQENYGFLVATTSANGVNTDFSNSVQNYVNLIGNSSKIILHQPVPPVAVGDSYTANQDKFDILFDNTAANYQNMYIADLGQTFQYAYDGTWGYNPNPETLRYDAQFQYHYQNSGGFLIAVHFYSMIFGNKPCIPTQMRFYGGVGNVSQVVSQHHNLAQIGYIHVPYIIHGYPTSAECQTNFTLYGYPATCD